MITKSEKSLPEELELKKVPYERKKKYIKLKNNQTIIIVLILINLCVIIGISFLIYYLFKQKYEIKIQDYESRIQAKDNEIENMKKQLNNKIPEKSEIEQKYTRAKQYKTKRFISLTKRIFIRYRILSKE